MSTKNDKSSSALHELAKEIEASLGKEKLEEFYITHSSREFDQFCKQQWGISGYYGSRLLHEYFHIPKKPRSASYSYWLEHMRKTHEELYGGIGYASKELREKSLTTALEKHGSETYNNRDAAAKTRLERYGSSTYNNIEKAVQTSISRYGGVGYASPELCKKSKQTTAMRYGNENYVNVEKRAKSCLARWGKDNYNNRAQMQETCLKRYGVRSYSQTVDFHSKRKKRYMYQDLTFDSSAELAVWIYCKDNNIEIQFSSVCFEYTVDGIRHKYYPDFLIKNCLIEIKGDHFFDGDHMINPFCREEDAVYEAKHQCGLKNGVLFVKYSELSKVFSYIDTTYGKNYLSRFSVRG